MAPPTTSSAAKSPTCPLCHRSFPCGVAAGQGTCWCFAVTVPRELVELLPPELQGEACLCPDCVDHATVIMRQKKQSLTLDELLRRRKT